MSFFYIIKDIELDDQPGAGDVALLAAGGEIDYSASPQLRERLADHIIAGRRQLVIDLSEATFIDSTAIGALIGALVRLGEEGGGTMAIVCAAENRKVLRILDIAGIDNAIELYHTREEALAAHAVAD